MELPSFVSETKVIIYLNSIKVFDSKSFLKLAQRCIQTIMKKTKHYILCLIVNLVSFNCDSSLNCLIVFIIISPKLILYIYLVIAIITNECWFIFQPKKFLSSLHQKPWLRSLLLSISILLCLVVGEVRWFDVMITYISEIS